MHGLRCSKEYVHPRRAGRRLTATSEFTMDGVSVDPLEVMFVKVKSYMLTSEWSFSKKAAKYQEWQQQQVRARALARARDALGRSGHAYMCACVSVCACECV